VIKPCSRIRRPALTLCLTSLVAANCLLIGCSRGPTPISAPKFDSSGVASRAMAIYDTDGDGYLAGEELENAPGIKAALTNLDADGDGKVSAEEIANRVRTWQQMNVGLMSISCEVHLDGYPLEGATVLFDPEEFLGGAIQQAIGETSVAGIAYPTVPKEKRPSADTPPGIQAGIYLVRISKEVNGKETIPARYNTETTLGQEVAKDDPAITNKQVIFKLSSR